MRLLPGLLAVLLAAALMPAVQAQTVTGSVADSTGLPLPGATVILSNQSSGVLAAFATADTSGAFRLPAVAPGAYSLRVTFVGFNASTRPVDVPAAGGAVDIGRIVLRPREDALGQLEIVAGRDPVVVRGDTLVYNAADFEVRAGATVEGLLSEMPGIEVDGDGTVRAQGRVVDRVTVDGRDFFGNTPSMATRNLPADAVERVEVFDERTDSTASGRRTLNLELREDRRQSLFGRAEGGGGADVADPAAVRYAGRASVNRFGPALRLSAIGSANNVNEPGLTADEYFGLVGTGDVQSGDIVRVDSPVLLDADDIRGFASSWTGGANLTWDAAPGAAVQASYVGYAARTVTASETVRERPAADSGTATETETADGASTGWVHRVEARADRTFGDGHSLRLTTTLDAQGGGGDASVERRADDVGLAGATAYRTASTRENARLGAVYARPLGSRWTARAEIDATLGLRDEDARNDCRVCTDAPLPGGIPLRGTAQGVVARAAATRPLGGTRSVQVRAEQTVDVQTQARRDDGAAGPAAYRRPYAVTSAGAVVSGGTRTVRASAGADLALIRRGDLSERGALRLLPAATLNYTIAQNQTLRLRYAARPDPTSVFALHAVPTLLSPFQVHVGNPALRDATSHTATAQYTDVNVSGGTTLFAYVTATYDRDAQAYARTVDAAGVTTVVPVNAGDALSLSGSGSYERSMPGLAARATLSGRHSSAMQVLNGLPGAVAVTQGEADLRLRRRGGALRQSQIGLRATVQSLTVGPGIGLSQTTARLNPYGRLAVTTAWGTLRVSAEQEVRIGALAYPARAPLADVELALPPVGRVSASVTASDVLNGGVSIVQEITPGFAETSRVETLGRRLVFRLTRTF